VATVLSQNEIDELLHALASGTDILSESKEDDAPASVRPYNFRMANKFSKEQMRTLHFIYDNYSRRLATFLSGTLRALCEVEVVSVEEQSFGEFSNSMPTPVLLSIINMPPLQGLALMVFGPTIAYEMISRLFGGSGYTSQLEKPFTEIELAILMRVVRQMVGITSEAWEKVLKVAMSMERLETSPQFAQIVAATEPIAIITMKATIGEVSDIINICIPHVAIQPIAKQLATKLWYSSSAMLHQTRSQAEVISRRIAGTQVCLQALLDETSATVREILGLQVGDVIRLDHHIDKSITVKVEHIPKFKGVIGTKESLYAIEITEILTEETDDE
jgi:flagellar motor switch protein FliM